MSLLAETNLTVNPLAWKPLIQVDIRVDENGMMAGEAAVTGR